MNDLLERLRYHGNHCLDRQGEQSKTMLEAAAEIERLLADRETYNAWAAEIKVGVDALKAEAVDVDRLLSDVGSYHPHNKLFNPKSPE